MQIECRLVHPPVCRVVLVAALVVGACGQLVPEQALTTADELAIVTTVDSLTRAFEQAERDRNPDRVLALIAPDFYMYADGVRAEYGEVASNIREIRSFQHFEPGWDDLEVRVLGRDAALTSFTFRDSIVTGTGEIVLARGATTLIWKRRDGAWRVVYADADHYPFE